jgi:hypothetical protein
MCQWVGAGGSAFVALVVGYVVVQGAGRLGLRHDQSSASGLMAGALALLVTADLLVPGWGDWWAGRPMLAATVTGGLVLGLTVLFVDAAIEVRRAKAVGRVLSGPLRQLVFTALLGDLSTARSSLAAVQPPRQVLGDLSIRWGEQDELQKGLDALVAAAEDFRSSVADIRSDLLAGGEQMHELYQACWEAGPAAQYAEHAVGRLRAEHTAVDDSLLRLGSSQDDARIGYIAWLWNEVGRSYNGLAKVVQAFVQEVEELAAREDREVPSLRILAPEPLDGFPDPTHMYYLGPATTPGDTGPAPQPSG